ncbi:TolC family protein [Cysteiniphilum sp. QT6929]|uniref:TolC family protein n=1 Tax=Cysteiniphilum sp. QT6929 TaxID=2975055 RepID=UPI0024B320F4|nr:TolC family protein [Cysteiniphilum sp. QT6929]WHN65406.1 TolC family protein [Cysteiniphilum sp. QT6929]
MDNPANKLTRSIKLLPIALAALVITGCSITPKAVDHETQLNNTYKGLHNAFNAQQAIDHKITLSEAIARTLKYNLDHKVQQAQLMLESGNLKAAYMEMLPALNAGVDYSFRNNDLIQNLVNSDGQVVSGEQSFTPREVINQSYGLQWSLLDLGLSYTRAQQQANRVMIAEEERRKITQQLIQEVVSAYWKAWTAQTMISEVTRFKEKAELALKRSKEAASSKANTPQIELDYQQVLIKAIRKINQLNAQIADAKATLARLMNASPDSKFELTNPGTDLAQLPDINPQFEKMDTLALIYRPELRQASYQAEIAKKGIQAAIINMLPGIDFTFGYNATNNEFMKNQYWWGGNIGASLNLIQTVLTGPYAISLANQTHSFEQLKQIATTITVLTQVRIAYTNYLLWQEDAHYAVQEAKVSMALFDHAEKLEKANQGNEQITIRRGIEAISAQFDKDVTLARAHEALSKLYQSIGLDIMPAEARNMPLAELEKKVSTVLKAQSQGEFNSEINKAYADIKPTLDKIKANMLAEEKAQTTKAAKTTNVTPAANSKDSKDNKVSNTTPATSSSSVKAGKTANTTNTK